MNRLILIATASLTLTVPAWAAQSVRQHADEIPVALGPDIADGGGARDDRAPDPPAGLEVVPHLNHASLSWIAPGDDGSQPGTVSRYKIFYSPTSFDRNDPPSDVSTVNLVAGPGVTLVSQGATQHYDLLNLEEGWSLYIMVRAADEVPNWSGSSELVYRELDDENPEGVTELGAAITLDPYRLQVSWREALDNGASGKASEYEVRAFESPVGTHQTPEEWFDGPNYVVAVTTPAMSGQSLEMMGAEFIPPILRYTFYVGVRAKDPSANDGPVVFVTALSTLSGQEIQGSEEGSTAGSCSGSSAPTGGWRIALASATLLAACLIRRV